MHKLNEDMIRREADAPATGLAAVYAARAELERQRMLDRATEVARTGQGAPAAAEVAHAHRPAAR